MAFFSFSPIGRVSVEQLAVVLGFASLLEPCAFVAVSCDNFLFSTLLERVISLYQHAQHEGISRQVHDFRCGLFFSSWSLVRFNCAPIRRVDEHLSRPEGCDLNFEGLEPYHESCTDLWTHHFSLTCSPWVPYFMCAPVLGQVWVLPVPR